MKSYANSADDLHIVKTIASDDVTRKWRTGVGPMRPTPVLLINYEHFIQI